MVVSFVTEAEIRKKNNNNESHTFLKQNQLHK